MTRTACVGITVQDRIYSLSTSPEGGGKYQANHYLEVGGGPAVTAAVATAKLGVGVNFIGRIGDDSRRNTLLTELRDWGVSTAFCRRYPNAHSSQSAILVDQHGERTIVNYPSPDLGTDVERLKTIGSSRCDLILADIRQRSNIEKAFSLAHLMDVATLLDADMTPQDTSPLVTLADHAVFSAPGLRRMTGLQLPEEGLFQATARTVGEVYVTLGSEGSLWIENNRLRRQETSSVNVVDAIGAGDVFHGALAVALVEKIPTKEATRFASAVAAMKCIQSGGRADIPNRK